MCTSFQNLLDLDVVGAEAAVEFEVICVVEERSTERKQQLLNGNKRRRRTTERIKRMKCDGLLITFRQTLQIRTRGKKTKDHCESQREGESSHAEW